MDYLSLVIQLVSLAVTIAVGVMAIKVQIATLEGKVNASLAALDGRMTSIARLEDQHLRRNLDGVFKDIDERLSALETWRHDHETIRHYKSE